MVRRRKDEKQKNELGLHKEDSCQQTCKDLFKNLEKAREGNDWKNVTSFDVSTLSWWNTRRLHGTSGHHNFFSACGAERIRSPLHFSCRPEVCLQMNAEENFMRCINRGEENRFAVQFNSWDLNHVILRKNFFRYMCCLFSLFCWAGWQVMDGVFEVSTARRFLVPVAVDKAFLLPIFFLFWKLSPVQLRLWLILFVIHVCKINISSYF